MNASETANHIANTSFYPTSPSDLQVRKEEYESLGYEVVLSKPLDFEPEAVELKPRRTLIFLCETCGSKIGGDGKCWCGNHFPEYLNY